MSIKASALKDGKHLDIVHHEWRYNFMFSRNLEDRESICKELSWIFRLFASGRMADWSAVGIRESERGWFAEGLKIGACAGLVVDLWQQGFLMEVLEHQLADFLVFHSRLQRWSSKNRVRLNPCKASESFNAFTCCIFTCWLACLSKATKAWGRFTFQCFFLVQRYFWFSLVFLRFPWFIFHCFWLG